MTVFLLYHLPVIAVCAVYLILECRRQPAPDARPNGLWKMLPVTLPLTAIGTGLCIAAVSLISFLLNRPFTALSLGRFFTPFSMLMIGFIAGLSLMPVRMLSGRWSLSKKSRIVTASVVTALYEAELLIFSIYVLTNV